MITWFQQKLKFGAKDHMRSQCWVTLVDCILGLKEPLKTISRKRALQNLSSDLDIEKASESNAKLSNQTPGNKNCNKLINCLPHISPNVKHKLFNFPPFYNIYFSCSSAWILLWRLRKSRPAKVFEIPK